MNTLIELYDKSPMKNIIAVLHYQPENLVYLYDETIDIVSIQDIFYKLLRSKKMKVKIEFIRVNTDHFNEILQFYHELNQKYDQITFDLTGGNELMLISAGLFCRANDIECIYIDFKEKKVKNIFHETEEYINMPTFLVREVIGAFGGSLLRSDHYHPDINNREMIQDILNIFEFVKKDVNRWNKFIKYMQRVIKSFGDTLNISVKDPLIFNEMVYCDYNLLLELQKIGIIHSLFKKQSMIRFTFKNEILKELHKNQGVWLELFTYITAVEMNYFDDVLMSAIIDWDGKESFFDTTNEIDLILTKDITPIFISCKISEPNSLALSEIKLLSKKFGGETSKAVLVTAYELSKYSKSLYLRAKEMDINVIELSDLKKEKLSNLLKSIAEDTFQYKI